MFLQKLLEHRSISNPTFLHLIHSFQEHHLFSGVYTVFPDAINSLQVYELGKQVGSQGAKVIHFMSAYVALPQQRRMAVYEHVISFYEQGCSQTEIAAQLHLSRKRVRQFMKGPPSPPVYKQRSTKLAPYKSYLKQRFAEDGRGNSL